MKTYNQLLNEADGAKLTSDYNRYLLEKQYFISRKTANILLEEDDEDYDGSSSPAVPFSRAYKGNKIYVHIDDDGRRIIRVVDSPEEAKMLQQNFDTAIAYDNGGNQLNLRERLEDGVGDIKTESPRQDLRGQFAKSMQTLRTKFESDIKKNEEELKAEYTRMFGAEAAEKMSKDNGLRQTAMRKSVYDDPSLSNVLSKTEYESMGAKYSEPLLLQQLTPTIYAPTKGMTIDDIKEPSRIYATGEAEGPVNPEDLPKNIKFIAPSSRDFAELSGEAQGGQALKDWASQPENIKTALSMGVGFGGGMGLLRAGISAIPKVGLAIAPRVVQGVGAAAAGKYVYDLGQEIEKEAEEALKGRSVTVGQKAAGEAVGEFIVGIPGYKIGQGPFKGRTPRTTAFGSPETPSPQVTEPAPKMEIKGPDVKFAVPETPSRGSVATPKPIDVAKPQTGSSQGPKVTEPTTDYSTITFTPPETPTNKPFVMPEPMTGVNPRIRMVRGPYGEMKLELVGKEGTVQYPGRGASKVSAPEKTGTRESLAKPSEKPSAKTVAGVALSSPAAVLGAMDPVMPKTPTPTAPTAEVFRMPKSEGGLRIETRPVGYELPSRSSTPSTPSTPSPKPTEGSFGTIGSATKITSTPKTSTPVSSERSSVTADFTSVSDESTKDIEQQTLDQQQPQPIFGSDIAPPIIASILSSLGGGDGGGKSTEPPIGKPQPKQKAGGIIPSLPSDDQEDGYEASSKDLSPENWDLVMKNIYGKYAGTLTK